MLRAIRAIANWWLVRRLPTDLGSGDVCVVVDQEGYKIAKVLSIDQATVHVRVFKNQLRESPGTVDTGKLSLGTIYDEDGCGIGHLPLSRSAFATWYPVRIQRESVSDEELEGYRIWEESKGGTWI